MPDGDWAEYKKLVISTMERLQKWNGDLQKELNSLKTDMAVIKTKIAAYACVVGAIATIAINALWKILGG